MTKAIELDKHILVMYHAPALLLICTSKRAARSSATTLTLHLDVKIRLFPSFSQDRLLLFHDIKIRVFYHSRKLNTRK